MDDKRTPDEDEAMPGEVFDPRNIRHLEAYFRFAGLSRKEAKAILAHGFAALATVH